MARTKETMPAGHGELVCRPAFEEWAAGARANAEAAATWEFLLCDAPVGPIRAMARADAIESAREFSARLGVDVREVADEPALIAVTGHQPEFYHPGVWIKDFLLQRFSEESGAAAIDIMVDSDGFDTLEVHSPCLKPDVRVCRSYLAVGTSDGYFAHTPVPPAEALETFADGVAEQLASLPSPAIGHHFATFREHLGTAAADAENAAELVTFARRRYEASAGTDYLELPLTSLSRSRAFAVFAAHIALDAGAFAGAYNAALAEYRTRTGVRNAAQPFPDLRVEGDLVELPLWHLSAEGRVPVWARTGEWPALVVGGEVVCDLGMSAVAPLAVMASPLVLAPKALTLTMFTRLLVADWFVHGVGGGRYDQVTDDVIRRYFGVEPPAFAVASLTMYLPLGAHVVRDEEIEAVAMGLNRLKHNPDQMLDEIEFDTAEEHDRAVALAGEKASLVSAIAAPDADKKSLGARIREVNDALAAMLAPIEEQMTAELEQLRALREAGEVLTDRTYPFCLWSPGEIADKAR
ncbi:MAG: hypothetical protein Q7W30_01095 [Coriobacteriia bacterium]|nr:hypothetical protein [Coriobacteriia bacterium]